MIVSVFERGAIIESTEEAKDDFASICYGAEDVELELKDIVALLNGKTIAFGINCDEYAVFIKLKKEEEE